MVQILGRVLSNNRYAYIEQFHKYIRNKVFSWIHKFTALHLCNYDNLSCLLLMLQIIMNVIQGLQSGLAN